MRLLNKINFLLLITSIICCKNIFASDPNHIITPGELFRPQHVDRPWSILLYGGITMNEDLSQIVVFNASSSGEQIYSLEGAYIFYRNLFCELQVAGNFAMRFDSHQSPVEEGDVYAMLRLISFPWNKYVYTTIAAGEGVSLTSDEPYSEKLNTKGSPNFLDFLTFELTFSLPSHPEWQLVGRIHHRSGMYGTFCSRDFNAGSNALGIGVRYFF